jgi:O-antigen ligase
MPDLYTQAGIALVTVVAGWALISGVRKTVKRGEWSVGAVLGGCLVAFTFSVVQLIATYLNAWTKVTDVYRNVSYQAPEWAQTCLRVTTPLLGMGAAAVFFIGLSRRNAQVNVPAVLLVIVSLVSMGSAVLHGDFPFRMFSLLYLCILLACVFAPRGLGVHLGIAGVCMVAAIASGVALIAYRDFSVIECVAGHKCGVLGFNFRGVLDNENAFALFLALAVPFVYIAFRGWEGLVMSLYMVGLVLLTGSRSGTLAAVVTMAVLILVRPDIRRPARNPVRSAVMASGLLVLMVIGIVLPLAVADPGAISGRAALWQLARGALADPATFFYGTGVFGWEHMRDAGLIDSSAVYSVHNQWLHVLFATGVIGLVVFLGAIAMLLWQARKGHLLVVCCVLTPYFVLGITERPWPIDTADWLTWAVPGALLCYPVLRATPLPHNGEIEAADVRPQAPAAGAGTASSSRGEEKVPSS